MMAQQTEYNKKIILYTIKCNKKGDAYTFFILFFVKKRIPDFPLYVFYFIKNTAKQAETVKSETKKK